jgi:hypothetical protein
LVGLTPVLAKTEINLNLKMFKFFPYNFFTALNDKGNNGEDLTGGYYDGIS